MFLITEIFPASYLFTHFRSKSLSLQDFLKRLSQWSSLNVRDIGSHANGTKCVILVFYVRFDFRFHGGD
jgi:hypothetical protein